MAFDFHVHGLWILGAIFLLLATIILGNIEWVEGTTPWSFGLSLIIAFFLIMVAGMCWISAPVNLREER